jgi:ABC-type transport system involved in multi-copper enzyme maturation permease subunit
LDNAEKHLAFYTDSDQSQTDETGTERFRTIDDVNESVQDIKSYYDKYHSAYRTYYNAVQQNSSHKDSYKASLKTAQENFRSAISTFSSKFESTIYSEYTTILTTEALRIDITSLLGKVEGYYSTYESQTDVDGAVIRQLQNDNYFATLEDYTSQLLPFEVDSSDIEGLQDYITTARTRLGSSEEGSESGYYKIINDFNNTGDNSKSTNSADLKTIKSYILDYYLTAYYASDIVISTIKISGLSKYSATDITKFSAFENSNYYQMKESLARTKYLFEHDQFEYEYASVFSISQPSNTDINAYDYSYFAMRLCTLFITVYIVVLAAGTIAGEQATGTLKFLAIRPYKRNKILTGKILAILAIAGILLGVTSVATLVIGGVNYGFASANVLAVFNARKAFVVSPVIMYIIALLSMFIEIAFYALLSIFISTILKSNIGAVAVSILIFFVSLVLNIVAVNVVALSFLPFTNINLFKYLGASFIGNTGSQGAIQNILTPTVSIGANFWLSLVILIVTEVVICYVTYSLFNKRDIK